MKFDKPVHFFKQIAFSNPLCPVSNCFSETKFVSWLDSNDREHVQIIRGLWRELREHDTWVYEEVDNESYSLEVGVKLYQIEAQDRYNLRKMPEVIAAALARDPFMPHASGE